MTSYPGLHIEYLEADPRLQALCLRYWRVDGATGRFAETVARIYREENLSQSEFTALVRRHSRAWSTVMKCSRCAEPLLFGTRTDFISRREDRPFRCQACAATEQQQVDIAKRLRIVQSFEQAMAEGRPLSALRPRHCLYLLALLKYAGSEDLSHIRPYCQVRHERLTPLREVDRDLINELWRAGVIAVDPASDAAAIELDREQNARVHFNEVRWHPVVQGLGGVALHERLEAHVAQPAFLRRCLDEVRECCEQLALQECLAFLEMALAEYRLGYRAGDKTCAMIKAALQVFSVAQVCNVLYRAARDAAAFYQRGGVSRDHAAKTVVGSFERLMEKTLANEWVVAPFRRNFNLQQSVLSRLIYNRVLGTDDGGFTERNDVLLGRLVAAPSQ
ncbi:hypothetical protein PMM47T1_18880 [Pseudomonas sp. M47T1]|uniref:hypothetical protein n=1 Tax=unclassified Pseudomonas TaxID=196821 RepID=UPI0002606C1B|nr:hypothetical protein [Pseudomonas sp. M47T1]EIK95047.1 hypothetical protein PMM47T1_18880 [Pseudomonas sp. M47T1]